MEAQPELKLTDRDIFALNKFYVRVLRIIVRELQEQRDLLELIYCNLEDEP